MVHKRAFFSFLRTRWTTLFDARFDVLLYDLTSTYFESDPPFDDKRRFGVAEREELTETGLGSTARCRGRRRHRQANSVRAGVVQTLSVQQAQPTDDN